MSRAKSEDLVGRKVSVLYRLEGDPRYPMNELVGVVQRVEGETEGERTLFIRKRDGTLTGVRQTSIVKLKIVPPSSNGPSPQLPGSLPW